MRPTFDQRDAELLAERQRQRDLLSQTAPPLVGDVVQMPDGTERRITRNDGKTVQLTVPQFDASFHFWRHGHLDFSGSLDFGHSPDKFSRIGTSQAPAWFFHHDEVGAHRGVYCDVTVTRWKLAA